MNTHLLVDQIMSPITLEPAERLWECHSCGAIVRLPFTHAEWHNESGSS